MNGQALHTTSNGDLHTNGSQKSRLNSSTYFGHDREEVTRILIQSLYELGYDGAASLLSKESGYQLESPAVATFRNAVLEGRWAEAEQILVHSFHYERDSGRGGRRTEQHPTKERLVLVEHAEKNEMLFHLRQQKFLELLEARDLGAALIVLRHELTPLNYDIGRLHALSRWDLYLAFPLMRKCAANLPSKSLLMCPPEHLHDQAGWDSPISSSRERLLSELSSMSQLKSIPST